MKSFFYKIRFATPFGQLINLDKREIELNLLPSKDYTIRPWKSDKINEANIFDVFSSQFKTKEEAEEDAKRLEIALLLTGIRLRLGFYMGESIKFLEDGYYDPVIIDNVYHYKVNEINELGIQIHENKIQVKTGMTNLTITDLGNHERLFKVLKRAYFKNKTLSGKQKLALEICNLAQFETSEAAGFISLITTIEVLSIKLDRPRKELDLIKKFESETEESDLSSESINSIMGSLRSLRKKSIGKSCANFIEEHLGVDKAEEFNKLYKIRSSLVHSGTVKDNINLSDEYSSLQRIVIPILIRNIFGEDIFSDLI